MSMTPPNSNPNEALATAAAAAAHAQIADGQAKLAALVPTAAGWYRDVNNQTWSFDGTTWTWHQTNSMISYAGWTDITTYVPFEEIEEPLLLMTPEEALAQADADLATAQSEVEAAQAEIEAETPPDSGDSPAG